MYLMYSRLAFPFPPSSSTFLISTYHSMCITVRVGRTFAHLHLEATLVVGQQLLGSMVPDDVRRRFESASDHAPQHNGAASLNVTVRVADQLRAGHCNSGKAVAVGEWMKFKLIE